MGLFDFLQGSRRDHFIPLEKSDAFGPGPLVVMYAVPDSMEDDELLDMVEDGMPGRARGDIAIQRLSGMEEDGNGGAGLLDCTVCDALTAAMASSRSSIGISIPMAAAASTITQPMAAASPPQEESPCPVLYFSGVSNTEMMETYKIIADEIYEETGGVHWPACAKVVPPAMKKSMRQVLMEISGDHADAMRGRREDAERMEAAE